METVTIEAFTEFTFGPDEFTTAGQPYRLCSERRRGEHTGDGARTSARTSARSRTPLRKLQDPTAGTRGLSAFRADVHHPGAGGTYQIVCEIGHFGLECSTGNIIVRCLVCSLRELLPGGTRHAAAVVWTFQAVPSLRSCAMLAHHRLAMPISTAAHPMPQLTPSTEPSCVRPSVLMGTRR